MKLFNIICILIILLAVTIVNCIAPGKQCIIYKGNSDTVKACGSTFDNEKIKNGRWLFVTEYKPITVVETGLYVNGNREGLWLSYHKNPKQTLIMSKHLKNNHPVDTTLIVNEKMQLVSEYIYDDDGNPVKNIQHNSADVSAPGFPLPTPFMFESEDNLDTQNINDNVVVANCWTNRINVFVIVIAIIMLIGNIVAFIK